MPKPYSEDLRRKVIEAYESKNMKIKEICKVFNITRKTLLLWRKKRNCAYKTNFELSKRT
ncbi:helix-turn-helix domain-containing protein [Spiroplasma ixodetis]|uniref:Transposase Synechocystis PCC 6803 domain-containing protein n=1 Tax=Spiroplasma ixodetis TaxID=2141 RepID=A0ABM8JKM0_9MOLU